MNYAGFGWNLDMRSLVFQKAEKQMSWSMYSLAWEASEAARPEPVLGPATVAAGQWSGCGGHRPWDVKDWDWGGFGEEADVDSDKAAEK